MSYRRCAAQTCFNTHNCRPNLKFFNFPKDEDSCRQWVMNCGRQDFLDKTPEQISKFVLCADHFEKDLFLNPKYKTTFKRTIIPVPTIFRNNLADFLPKSLQKNFEETTSRTGKSRTYSRIKKEGCSSNESGGDDEMVMIQEIDGLQVVSIYSMGEEDFNNMSPDDRSSQYLNSCEIVKFDSEDEEVETGVEDYANRIGCHKMCRLCACLVLEETLVSAFHREDGKRSLLDKLHRLLPEKISEDDGLPQVVCASCLHKVNRCDEIIESFLVAHKKLSYLFYAQLPSSQEVEIRVQNLEQNQGSSLEEETAQSPESRENPAYEQLTEEFLIVDDTPSLAITEGSPPNNCLVVKTQSVDLNDKEDASVDEVELDVIEPSPLSSREGDDTPEPHEEKVTVTSLTEVCDKYEGGTFQFSNPTEEISATIVSEDFEEVMIPLEDTNVLKGEQTEGDEQLFVTGDWEVSFPTEHKHTYKKREVQTCEECGKSFLGVKPLKRHVREAHIPDANMCEFCGARYKVRSQLVVHRLVHTNERPHVCEACNVRFAFKKQLKRHNRMVHGSLGERSGALSLTCSICDKVCLNKSSLWRHRRTHSKAGRSLCFQCGKVLANAASLRVHMRTHSKDRPYTCQTCNRSFKDKVTMMRHVAMHSEEKRFSCDVCGRLFASTALVRQHLLTHSGVRPFTCEHCGAAFNRPGNLNQHKKKHLDNAPPEDPLQPSAIYECVICAKRVRSELTLKYHMSKHTGEKRPYDCQVCSKRFMTSEAYHVHMRIHTGERPYVCSICHKAFRSHNTLKQHSGLHRDDLPHSCPYCERGFKRLQSLIVHKRTHTGEKPYACNVCSRGFAQRGDMLKHARTHTRHTSKLSHIQPALLQLDHITELALSDSDITSEYLIDMPIVEVETEIQEDM